MSLKAVNVFAFACHDDFGQGLLMRARAVTKKSCVVSDKGFKNIIGTGEIFITFFPILFDTHYTFLATIHMLFTYDFQQFQILSFGKDLNCCCGDFRYTFKLHSK